MEFRVLGPLEVFSNGRALELGGQKQRALLAALLIEANRVVSADRLIEALWEDAPPATAQKALQVYVSHLRRVLGKERLQTKPPGYVLHAGSEELDLFRFERLQKEGKPDDALALWRGPPLADFAYRRFAQAEIARLEERRSVCLEQRIAGELERGRHGELVGEVERLVAEHPLRERLRAQLMLVLYRSGRQAEALEAYQAARRALVEELGIEPGRELRELHRSILRQDPALELGLEATTVGGPGRSVLVGREPELAELLAGLEDAFAGRGRLVLLVGEPGIGKSRLAEELVANARARGAGVLVGRCWEAGGAPAYWPWVQSLRACILESPAESLRGQLGPGAADLAQLLPELRDLVPGLPEPHAGESEGARFRLFEAVSSLLTAVAKPRPLVLVLDDLHAADEPSLLLLQFLARQIERSRCLVVGALRDVDPSPSDPLTAALTELAREPVTRTLVLGGLAEGEVASLMELAFGKAPNESLVHAVHEETEGNPLFVGEIARLLATEGDLDRPGARVAIPPRVRDVIARRLRHLSEECNRVLLLASVLGREFALDALTRVGGGSEDRLLDALDEAMAARVVSDVPGSRARLRFAHVLIRDTLYEGLTTARRVQLHRRALDALERLYGDDPGQHLAELAYHAIAGSDFDKGLDYARRAGDRALALLAYEEAARLYETALEAVDLAGPADESTRCELLLLVGEALGRAGNMPSAKEAFFAAAELARRLRLPRELARAAVGYGGRIVFERAWADDRLVPLLEEGLAALGQEEVELRVRLLARLAGALRDEHSRARRDAISQEAIDLARRADNPVALAYALDGRASAIIAPDTIGECLALATELGKLAEEIGDSERIAGAQVHRFIARLLLGDVEGAEAEADAAMRVADDLRQPAQLWQAHGARTVLALFAGRFAEAEELMDKAFAYGERAQAMATSAYWLQRYALCEVRGGLEKVEPRIAELAARYPARPVLRCVLVHLESRLGRRAQAQAELAALSAGAFSALPFDMEWLYAMSLLAEACALLGDRGSAAVLTRLLAPWATLNAVNMAEGARGSVARYLGLLATAEGRWEVAERHFEAALVANERMGARPWLAHTRHDYGQMLRARDEPDDSARAQRLLELAVADYRELGMDRHAEAVEV